MNEWMTSHGVLPIARDCDSCEVGFCCENTRVALCLHILCMFQHYNCSGRSTLSSVLQPEVQHALPGLESSPSLAAHARDLPEHRSNSYLSGAGRSAQVPARAGTAEKGQSGVWSAGKYIGRVSPVWGQFCFRPSPQIELGSWTM